MKSLLCTAVLLMCFAGLLAGCTSEGSDKEVDVKKLAGELVSGVTFQDEMTEITPEMLSALYQIDEAKVADQSVYMSTGATAEEIAVIKASSSADVEAVKEAVKARVEFQKGEFENYVPQELDKLSDPVIEVVGDSVILCISNDNAKAEEIIKAYQ